MFLISVLLGLFFFLVYNTQSPLFNHSVLLIYLGLHRIGTYVTALDTQAS